MTFAPARMRTIDSHHHLPSAIPLAPFPEKVLIGQDHIYLEMKYERN